MRSGDRRRTQRGLTYVWAMAAVAVLGVGLAALGTAWTADARRAKEHELLRIGRLYAQAIADYRRVSPGSVQRYPQSLQELTEDNRFVGTVRHLRRLYEDPLDPKRPWGLVRDNDGRVRGVYSQSQDAPLRVEALDLGVVSLPQAAHYAEWQFVPKTTPP